MGFIRKAVRGTTFMATGVPLAHKHSKKDKIVRNTAAIAEALQQQQPLVTSTPLPTTPPPPPPQGPPAGWYQDPQGEAYYRWWDGARWTEHTG